MKTAYIGLGSNLGDSLQVLQQAWNNLGNRKSISLQSLSGPYRTEPVDMKSQHWFINAAGSLTTTLKPWELLQELLAFESKFGRIRDPAATGYRDRILDLDLLLFDNVVADAGNLVLPHPEMEHRLFVLRPLCEIAPEYIHPRLGRTIKELLQVLEKQQDFLPEVFRLSWQRS